MVIDKQVGSEVSGVDDYFAEYARRTNQIWGIPPNYNDDGDRQSTVSKCGSGDVHMGDVEGGGIGGHMSKLGIDLK